METRGNPCFEAVRSAASDATWTAEGVAPSQDAPAGSMTHRRFNEHGGALFPSSHETSGDWRTTTSQMIGVHSSIRSNPSIRCPDFSLRTTSSLSHVPSDSTASVVPEDIGVTSDAGPESMDFESGCSTTCSTKEGENSALQRVCLGLSSWSPWLDELLDSPSSLSQSIFLLVVFVVTSTCKFVMGEWAYDSRVNYFSLVAVSNAVSLSTSLLSSFAFEGFKAWKLIFHWSALWRFAAVSCLFTFSEAMQVFARWAGTSSIQLITVGYLYLPITVIMSYYVFNRLYGKLEWLTLGMMTMSVLTFVMLREQYKDLEESPLMRLKNSFTAAGFAMAVGAVVVSAGGSILAERIYKKESRGLKLWNGHFYIMKVHIDVTALILSLGLWGTSQVVIGHHDTLSNILSQWSVVPDLFGEWSACQFSMVALSVAQGWAAGLVTKEHSTTFKSIVQTLCYIFSMLVEDPVLGSRWGFQARELPSLLLTSILVLSSVVFQTGRQNVRVLERAAAMVSRNPGSTGTMQSLKNTFMRVSSDSLKSFVTSWKDMCRKNFLIVLYIIADAVRNLTLAKALSSTLINPNSMTLVVYVIGVMIASCMTLRFEGYRVLGQAWHPCKILKCLPAGFLFTLTMALMNMAYSQGMTAALALIIGKFYTPAAAIGARWVLDKYYMWLEYVALAILTLACMTFGYLQAFSPGRHSAWVENENMKVSMLLVFGSAVAAAFNSLLTERILKGDKAAFHVQKVSLDTSCILSTLVLIPLAGVISQRAQDIPWAARPVEHSCPADSVCWQTGGCALAGCDCACGTGLFAGWMTSTASVLVLALVINTVYGWLVGMLVQEFSTVDRAIADSFSLLAVYFLGDPLLNGSSLGNVSLDLVAFIVPMSTSIFAVAASEMQRVADLLSVQDTAAEDHP